MSATTKHMARVAELVWVALTCAVVGGCGRVNFVRVDARAVDVGERDGTTPPNDVPEVLDADALLPLGDVGIDSPSDGRLEGGVDVRGPEVVVGPCPLPTPRDYCTSLARLPSPPVIDGRVECGLPLRELEVWVGGGLPPEESRARAAFAWTPEGLYVFVKVRSRTRLPARESPLHCGESVEIYADSDGRFDASPRYDDPGTAQFVVAAPASIADREVRAEVVRNGVRVGAWLRPQAGVFPDDEGYIVEAVVRPEDLGLPRAGSLVAGAQIGFNLAANVPIAVAIPVDPGPIDASVADAVVIDAARVDASGVVEAGVVDACPTFRRGQHALRINARTTTACAGVPACDTGAFCTPTLAR